MRAGLVLLLITTSSCNVKLDGRNDRGPDAPREINMDPPITSDGPVMTDASTGGVGGADAAISPPTGGRSTFDAQVPFEGGMMPLDESTDATSDDDEDASSPLPLCVSGEVCATVTLAEALSSQSVHQLALALYGDGTLPTFTVAGLPGPQVKYDPQAVEASAAGPPYVFRQRFESPYEGEFRGPHYVAIHVLLSTGADPTPRDYWYVHPEVLDLYPGREFDLGDVTATLIGGLDDAATPGDDRAGHTLCPDEATTCASEPCCGYGMSPVTWICESGECSAELVQYCDGPEDCPEGKVCCLSPLGIGVAIECKDLLDCGAISQQVLCHRDADCGPSVACDEDAYVPACARDPFTPGDERPGFVVCDRPDTTTGNSVPNATPGSESCEGSCAVSVVESTVSCSALSPSTSAACDGHEDCDAGEYCCECNEAVYCTSDCTQVACGPGFGRRICHVDADCEANQACVAGAPLPPGGGRCQPR